MTAPLTTATTSTGAISIAFDYSTYYERMATALETIATNSTSIANNIQLVANSISTLTSQVAVIGMLSTSTGIRTTSPYDWSRSVELYSWYNQHLDVLRPTTATINTLVADINTVTSYLPKFQ